MSRNPTKGIISVCLYGQLQNTPHLHLYDRRFGELLAFYPFTPRLKPAVAVSALLSMWWSVFSAAHSLPMFHRHCYGEVPAFLEVLLQI